MSKVFIVSRTIVALDGRGRLTMPVVAFDDEEVAKQACVMRTRAMQEIIRMELATPSGARSGVTVGGVLQEMGITGFEHFIDPVEPHSTALIQAVEPSIIIPR